MGALTSLLCINRIKKREDPPPTHTHLWGGPFMGPIYGFFGLCDPSTSQLWDPPGPFWDGPGLE